MNLIKVYHENMDRNGYNNQVSIIVNLLIQINYRNTYTSSAILEHLSTVDLKEYATGEENGFIHFLVELIINGCVPIVNFLQNFILPNLEKMYSNLVSIFTYIRRMCRL